MSCCVTKNYYSPQKKWILLLNTAEIRRKTQVRQPYCNLYAYGANNPVRYIDPDGRYLINNIKVFNNYGRPETAESYALSNFDEIRKTAGKSSRLGWWQVDGIYKLLPLYSSTPGFQNDVAFADKQTMSTLKSIAGSQKNKDNFIKEIVFSKVTTEKKENGVVAVNLTVSRITTDYKNNIVDITDPITVTLAFTTDEELERFKTREAGLKIMAKDALQKANIELDFGVEK
ncbi:hypothetical protein [Treponema sp. Marseille-Q4130]|uniref:hypothetical protein n=1 Tax=Treponema sp. Marseille-Q4130 TaxID=2766702 RepID=UPI0016529022|nr:hypothetical protein [Treponema sp. Marseille-Q4130]MBC6719227.1 hypothetical protein [Treponema sp. Marseille-Q4130]